MLSSSLRHWLQALSGANLFTLSTKTKAAAVAAILLGSVVGDVADAQFDVNTYRPTLQNSRLGAYAQPSAHAIAPRAVKPFTIQEKL